MIEVEIPQPLTDDEGNSRPSVRITVPVVKAKDEIEIEVSALPDDVYNEIIFLGAKALLNRGQSTITGTSYPDEEERASAAVEVATKTLADMYAGKIRRSSGAKASKQGKGELQVEARRLAKLYVKEQLKDEGLRVSLIKPAVITKLANELIETDPAIMEEARENVAKRKKVKARKIDLSKVVEDEDLVKKATQKGRSRKKKEVDEEAPAHVVGNRRPGQQLHR